jgi:PRTRC genetic system protein C
MAIIAEELTREFHYNGVKLVDPIPSADPEKVKAFYSALYPEVTSAVVEGPVFRGNKAVYTFKRSVGTKG